jgi:hypothetical protein
MMSPEEDVADGTWSPPVAAREPVWSSPSASSSLLGGVAAGGTQPAHSPHGAEVLVMLTAMFPTVRVWAQQRVARGVAGARARAGMRHVSCC